MTEAMNKEMAVLAKQVRELIPKAVARAMAKHDERGGSSELVLPSFEQTEELLTRVVFEPGPMVALFKLGEDPTQIIWGEQVPDADAYLACVRVDGVLEPWLYELDGSHTPLARAPGAGPYDFGDLPVTELINSKGWRSAGKGVRQRVAAAQLAVLSKMQDHVDQIARSSGPRADP